MTAVSRQEKTLFYHHQGNPQQPPVLMLMGLGRQYLHWPEALCQMLQQAGFLVLRMDNRDAGLSSKYPELGKANLSAAWQAMARKQPVPAGYDLSDMAADGISVLDQLGLEQAHIIGHSLGGMIGQLIAAEYPGRVKSLTCISSSSGAGGLPKPQPALLASLYSSPPAKASDTELISFYLKQERLLMSAEHPTPEAELSQQIAVALRRCHYLEGAGRQLLAMLASGDLSDQLTRVKTPSLVLHGDQDPLMPLACGTHIANSIAGARFECIPGLAHDLPASLLGQFARYLLEHMQSTQA